MSVVSSVVTSVSPDTHVTSLSAFDKDKRGKPILHLGHRTDKVINPKYVQQVEKWFEDRKNTTDRQRKDFRRLINAIYEQPRRLPCETENDPSGVACAPQMVGRNRKLTDRDPDAVISVRILVNVHGKALIDDRMREKAVSYLVMQSPVEWETFRSLFSRFPNPSLFNDVTQHKLDFDPDMQYTINEYGFVAQRDGAQEAKKAITGTTTRRRSDLDALRLTQAEALGTTTKPNRRDVLAGTRSVFVPPPVFTGKAAGVSGGGGANVVLANTRRGHVLTHQQQNFLWKTAPKQGTNVLQRAHESTFNGAPWGRLGDGTETWGTSFQDQFNDGEYERDKAKKPPVPKADEDESPTIAMRRTLAGVSQLKSEKRRPFKLKRSVWNYNENFADMMQRRIRFDLPGAPTKDASPALAKLDSWVAPPPPPPSV